VGVHTIHIEKAIKAINSLSDNFEAQKKTVMLSANKALKNDTLEQCAP
jgi:hypothetical protein